MVRFGLADNGPQIKPRLGAERLTEARPVFICQCGSDFAVSRSGAGHFPPGVAGGNLERIGRQRKVLDRLHGGGGAKRPVGGNDGFHREALEANLLRLRVYIHAVRLGRLRHRLAHPPRPAP